MKHLDIEKMFLSSETSGTLTDTLTIVTGATYLYSREYIFGKDYHYPGEATDISAFLQSADDDGSTPSLALQCAFHSGEDFMDIWHTVSGYSTSSPADLVSSFDAGDQFEANLRQQDWWMPSRGFKLRIVKTGAGAVTFSDSTVVVQWLE